MIVECEIGKESNLLTYKVLLTLDKLKYNLKKNKTSSGGIELPFAALKAVVLTIIRWAQERNY